MRSRIVALLLTTAIVGCMHRGQTREVSGVQIAEEGKGLWARARLKPDSEMKIAMKRVPGGRITKGELEEEDGRLIYSFDITTAGKSGEDEVHVDATTGEVVKVEHED